MTAAITAVGKYVPETILTNDMLSKMVATNDEWITSRTGIKERRILKEEGAGTSYMAIRAAKNLLEKVLPEIESINFPLIKALFRKLILDASFFHSSKLRSVIICLSIDLQEHRMKVLLLDQVLFEDNHLLVAYKLSMLQTIF